MWRVAFLTLGALVAFATNSILCRVALDSHSIDAASFTSVRIISGAVILWLLIAASSKQPSGGSWLSAAMLFAYAISFSFAYISLAAGTGALILFGAVQATMFAVGIARGERPPSLTWLGWALAVGGLVYLVLPGLKSPPLNAAALMAAAGIAWGFYSLRGRTSKDPVTSTAHNFLLAVPMTLVASIVFASHIRPTATGVTYAAISGAITSGIGYVLWYAALPHLTAARAAMVQLSVPALTAYVGVALLGESLTQRLLLASVLTLGGLAIALAANVKSKG